MNTNILALASSLSDQDLLARVGVLAGKERESSVELVAHLAVLDARPAVFAARRPRFALHLLHAGASALRRRHLQPYSGGSSLPRLSGDPRLAGLRRAVPHLGADAASAPHTGEPRSRARQGQWPKPARDRGPGRGAGATTGCPVFRPETPYGHASAHAHARDHVAGDARRGGHSWASRAGASDQLSTAPTDAPPDHRNHLARALPRPVHDRQGEPRQARARPGPSSPRDPGWRSGCDLRPRPHPAPREGGEGQARGNRQAAPTSYPPRGG
jgi:hypothetical protein